MIMVAKPLDSLKLLIPLDGSPLAEQALPYARMFADLLPTEVRLIRIIVPSVLETLTRYEEVFLSAASDTLGSHTEQVERMHEALNDEALRYLETQAAAFDGIPTRTEVAFGTPAELIAAAAASHDLVLMVTHGHSGMLRWAIGSVTARVLQLADKPILVIRSSDEQPTTVKAPRRIMVGLDGSPGAECALPLAAGIARAAGADLLLTQVIEPGNGYWGSINANEAVGRLRELAFSYLERMADSLRREANLNVTTTVPVGHIAEELVQEIERKQIDLVALGRRGFGGARSMFLGGTTEKVSQASPAPLLVAG
jgi:nucleotide-binding universal stress UspA family protein